MSFWSHMKFIKSYSASQKEFALPPSSCFELALVGKSNVGKSTFLNLLAEQKKLAKTSQKPGHTLTINRFECAPLGLGILDLPGWGFMNRSHEIQEEIRSALGQILESLSSLKAFLWLVDSRRFFDDPNLILPLNWMQGVSSDIFLVLTKFDKLNTKEKIHLKQGVLSFVNEKKLRGPFFTSRFDLNSFEIFKESLLSFLSSQSL